MNPGNGMESSNAIDDQQREAAAAWCVRLSHGPLSPAEQQAFQDWLDQDVAHPALLERTVAAWQVLDEHGFATPVVAMRRDALDRLAQSGERRRPRALAAFAAVAACLLLMVSGIWWHLSPTIYATGIGERRLVRLADGSTVSLDAATRVTVRYSGSRRELALLAGRAKFTVAKDPLRPFSVQAGERLVVATGTAFSIEHVARQVRVILYEGRVAVMNASDERGAPSSEAPPPAGSTAAAPPPALAPGQELRVAAADAASAPMITPADPVQSLDWESGQMLLRDEPLGVAVERMNRYAGGRLRLADPAAADIPVSGRFTNGDVAAFVEGITAVFPVKAEARDGKIWLSLRARRG